MIEEDAAEAQARLAEFVRAERQMEEAVVAAKFCHLHELARGEHSTDPKKAKRKGKAADRKTGGPVGGSLQKGFSSALVVRVSLS